MAIVHATNTIRPEGEKGPREQLVRREDELYLNWIDAAPDFFELSGPGVFSEALDFIGAHLKIGKILVHCDYGNSRSPTLALLYLAKRAHVLPDSSYDAARETFAKLYLDYYPGGIRIYVREHWDEIA